MIRQCAILFGCLALGELIVFLTGIKLPSSIIGMLLLTLFLKLGWIKLQWVQGLSDFIDALITLQKECKVHSIKLSEFGIQSEDFPKFLQNARDTMGGLFTLDPRPITDEEILHIFKKSYK